MEHKLITKNKFSNFIQTSTKTLDKKPKAGGFITVSLWPFFSVNKIWKITKTHFKQQDQLAHFLKHFPDLLLLLHKEGHQMSCCTFVFVHYCSINNKTFKVSAPIMKHNKSAAFNILDLNINWTKLNQSVLYMLSCVVVSAYILLYAVLMYMLYI